MPSRLESAGEGGARASYTSGCWPYAAGPPVLGERFAADAGRT